MIVRRTLLVCTLSALPLLVMAWLLAAHAPDGWTAGRTAHTALWCFDSAIPAALTSSVIYQARL